MNETSFAVLLGGSLSLTDRVRNAVAGCRVIAADSGIRHARDLGLIPELWVGDFDSSSTDMQGAWPGVERQPYPAEKALTDGEIAIAEAIARGATRLVLVGALHGDRSDHALQHYMQATSLALEGRSIFLTSGEEEAWPLVPGRLSLDLPEGSLFSVVGFCGLSGLSISGARYPLDRFELPFGSSRTLSNVAGGPIQISLSTGYGLVLARPHDFTGA